MCVVALTLAPPNTLPPVILPVAEINPPVSKLPPWTLPVTVNKPPVCKLPPVILPAVLKLDAMIVPIILPPVILPVVEKAPVPTIPTVTTLPVELNVAPTTDVPAFIIPAAFKLAPLTFPLTDRVPLTNCPSVVHTAMLDTPATDTVALPPAAGICMLVVPL